MIGRPYFYTRKSPNFAFFSSFFISIYLYLRSRDIGIAYTDAPRRYRPSTRRRTPTIYRDSLSLSEISLTISIPTKNRQSYIPTEISRASPRPSTQLSKFLGNRRKTLQSLGDLQIFDLLIG